MDFETVYSYIEEESKKTPFVIYVAIGCSLNAYPPNEHPPQQYPPYLDNFEQPKLCVLVDPRLEMPPRLLEDKPGDITILPIQKEYHHTSNYGDDTSWFLKKLAKLCIRTHNYLIVQEFTGADIHQYYPFECGREMLNYVMYDPTCGDGGCYLDLSAAKIYRNTEGHFIQPMYTPLHKLYRLVPSELFKTQYTGRTYSMLFIMLRFYRILRNIDEPRDWCTKELVEKHLQYYSFIYNTYSDNFMVCLRQTLIAVAMDIYTLSGIAFTVESATATVDSSGKEMEHLWKQAAAIS